QPVDLAQRVLVVVRRFGQEGDDLGRIEAAHPLAEPLLTQVERCDPHDTLGRRRAGARGRRAARSLLRLVWLTFVHASPSLSSVPGGREGRPYGSGPAWAAPTDRAAAWAAPTDRAAAWAAP